MNYLEISKNSIGSILQRFDLYVLTYISTILRKYYSKLVMLNNENLSRFGSLQQLSHSLLPPYMFL